MNNSINIYKAFLRKSSRGTEGPSAATGCGVCHAGLEGSQVRGQSSHRTREAASAVGSRASGSGGVSHAGLDGGQVSGEGGHQGWQVGGGGVGTPGVRWGGEAALDCGHVCGEGGAVCLVTLPCQHHGEGGGARVD